MNVSTQGDFVGMTTTGPLPPSAPPPLPPLARPFTPSVPLPQETGNAVSAPPADLSAIAETQTYSVAESATTALTFPDSTLSPGQAARVHDLDLLAPLLISTGGDQVSQLPAIPEAQQARLNSLAQSLGFRDARMLQHQLRNLPADRQQVLIAALKTAARLPESATPEGLNTALNRAFVAEVRHDLNGLFTRYHFPPPRYGGTSQWDGASICAFYNAASEMHAQSPEQFQRMARSSGSDSIGGPRPMIFNRDQTPPPMTSDGGNFLQDMQSAARIAKTDYTQGEITLYDAGVNGNHQAIVDQVGDKLALLSRETPSGEPDPRYTTAELKARGLDTMSPRALEEHVLNHYVQQFGGVEQLQKALNFVIGYRGLDRPEIVDPPLQLLNADGKLDTRTQNYLRRIGPARLLEVACRMEQMHATSVLQGFMRESSPYASQNNLATDGVYGRNTTVAVKQFQLSLALNMLKERIEDDRALPEPEKVRLLEFFQDKFQQLESTRGTNFGQIMQSVTHEVRQLLLRSDIDSTTRAGLITDLQALRPLVNGRFDQGTAEYLVNSWFNVMESGAGVDLGEQLIFHELGHNWQAALEHSSPLEVTRNWDQLFAYNDTLTFGTQAMTTQDYRDQLRSDTGSATDYAASNALDDFSESNRMFVYDPQRLMRRSLMKFLVMNSLQENRHSAQDILAMATASGYTQEQLQSTLQTILNGNQNLQFTTRFAAKLATDYAPLQSLLAGPGPLATAVAEDDVLTAAVSEERIGLASTQPVTETAEVPVPMVVAQDPGWVLDALGHRYQALVVAIQSSPAGAHRLLAEQALKVFETQFLNEGLSSLDPPEGAETALNGLLAQYGRNDDRETRALLLALAQMRATQNSPMLNPLLLQALPESFKDMRSDPTFTAAVGFRDGNRRLGPSLILENTLREMQQRGTRTEQLDTGLVEALSYLDSTQTDLGIEMVWDVMQMAISDYNSRYQPPLRPTSASELLDFLYSLKDAPIDVQTQRVRDWLMGDRPPA
jgi:hypothetical protein